jgi:anti-anti-sigma factor
LIARIAPRSLCCGCLLWCRKRIVDDIVVLDALRGGDLDSEDIAAFFRSTAWPGSVPRVVVNLQQVDFASSAFLAALLALQRRLEAAKGALVLCGANQVIRGIFVRTRLNSLFEIVDDENEALRRLCVDR